MFIQYQKAVKYLHYPMVKLGTQGRLVDDEKGARLQQGLLWVLVSILMGQINQLVIMRVVWN